MQAGYRTDPIKSAKALKAKLKVRKLDRALYGSDVKYDTAMNAISTSSKVSVGVGEDTINGSTSTAQSATLPSNTPPPAASTATITTTAPLSVPTPPSVRISNMTPMRTDPLFNLAEELKAKMRAGVRPSEIKASKQKTSITPATVPVAVVSTAPTTNTAQPTTGPQQVETPRRTVASETIPATTAPTMIPVGTSETASESARNRLNSTMNDKSNGSSEAPTAISSEAPTAISSEDRTTPQNDKKQSDMVVPIPPDTESKKGNNLTLKDPWLQEHAAELLKKVYEITEKNQVNTTLYTRDHKNAEPRRLTISQYKHKDNVKYNFRLYYDRRSNETIVDQHTYDLNYSVAQALKQIHSPTFRVDRATGEMTGLGMETAGSKIHWAHRRNLKDYDFVMYPAFANGNVRYYKSPKHKAVVSHNHASQHFLNIVRDVVDSGTFKAADYAGLDKKEAHAANMFIKESKPLIPSGVAFDTSNAGDIFELRKRYQVLVGELSAGNHGSMIKDEMISILQKLQRLKAMPASKANDLITGLREL